MTTTPDYGVLASDGKMNTRSGYKFNITDPSPETIVLEDIAYGLGYKPHYSGQTPFFFSIAQHSILVGDLVLKETNDPTLALVGLFHDAEEAYIGDMITQVKLMLPEFKIIGKKIQEVIFGKFTLPFDQLPAIKWADLEILKQEYDLFYKMSETMRMRYIQKNAGWNPNWAPLSPDESAGHFINKFNHYNNLLKVQQAIRK